MQTIPSVDLFALSALLPPQLFFGTVPADLGSFETLFQSALASAGGVPQGESQADLSAILAQLTPSHPGGAQPFGDLEAGDDMFLTDGALAGLPLPALHAVRARAQAVAATGVENHAAASFSTLPDVAALIQLVGERLASLASAKDTAAPVSDPGVAPVLQFVAHTVDAVSESPSGLPGTSSPVAAEVLGAVLSTGEPAPAGVIPTAVSAPEQVPADSLVPSPPGEPPVAPPASAGESSGSPPPQAFGARAAEVVATVLPVSTETPPVGPPVDVPVGPSAQATDAPVAQVPVVLPDQAAATSASVPFVARPETPPVHAVHAQAQAVGTPPVPHPEPEAVPPQPVPKPTGHVAGTPPSRVPLTAGTEVAQATAAGERAAPLGTLIPLTRATGTGATPAPVETPEAPAFGETPASSEPRALPTVARAPFTGVPRAATQAHVHTTVSQSTQTALPVEQLMEPAAEPGSAPGSDPSVPQRFNVLHMMVPRAATAERSAASDAPSHAETLVPPSDGIGTLRGFAETAETTRTPREVPVRTPLAQLSQQVIRSAQFLVREHGGTVHLRLEPEALGRLTVKVMQDHDVVRIELTAQSQQVREVLQGQLPNLKQQLEDQGLALGGLAVSVEADTQHEPAQRDTAPEAAPARMRTIRAANALAAAAPAPPVALATAGRLDLIA